MANKRAAITQGRGNDPRVVGVWADVIQLMEFTAMRTTFASGADPAMA